MVIIQCEFKDTKQIHWLNDKNRSDSLRRTALIEHATIFSCASEAKLYLDEFKQESHRFHECEYKYVFLQEEMSQDEINRIRMRGETKDLIAALDHYKWGHPSDEISSRIDSLIGLLMDSLQGEIH